MSIDFKRCKNTEPACSQKTEQPMEKKRRNSTAQPELGFLLGPITMFSFAESVVGEQPSTTNRIASRGSPHDPTMRTVLVIQRRGACTQPAHQIPSRRPHLRVVAWRQGMIGRLTLGARVRRNPAGFGGVLSWSRGYESFD